MRGSNEYPRPAWPSTSSVVRPIQESISSSIPSFAAPGPEMAAAVSTRAMMASRACKDVNEHQHQLRYVNPRSPMIAPREAQKNVQGEGAMRLAAHLVYDLVEQRHHLTEMLC